MPVSRSTSGAGRIRAIWFGMRCEFTRRAIASAIEDGTVVPTVVVLPSGPKPLGAGWPEPPLDRWLRERGVAIIEVDRLVDGDHRTVFGAVEEHRVEVGIGACFPYRIPASLRAVMPCGAVNIHPSLLPRLRGPEPVFHTFRQGLAETGVTIHVMDDGWDSGPILAQERVVVPERGSATEFEGALAHLGGSLLGGVVRAWCEGEIEPVPQDEGAASWAPVPGERERTVSAGLTMAQNARFVRACGPILAQDADTGELVSVVDAITADTREITQLRADRRLVRTRCRDGDLWLVRHAPQELPTESGWTI